jgi:bifunctional non-homologous end joining protein LigD
MSGGKLIFVVQKHAATHLHYDFRLQHKGILLSWAIPKKPSMSPSIKRLAIHVADHALSYANFEGELPEGSYGAGTVEIWDKGTYTARDAETKKESEKEISKGLREGHLKFTLHGKRLKGDFDLVRFRSGDKKNLWLLIKKRKR